MSRTSQIASYLRRLHHEFGFDDRSTRIEDDGFVVTLTTPRVTLKIYTYIVPFDGIGKRYCVDEITWREIPWRTLKPKTPAEDAQLPRHRYEHTEPLISFVPYRVLEAFLSGFVCPAPL